MTLAELAAEVLRIHDLIAAGEGPQTKEEWDRVIAPLRAVTGRASELREACEARPRMADGVGLCSVHCAHYHPLDGISREHSSSGQCLKVAMATRSMVPCRPWVDELRQEFAEERAKNAALHERIDKVYSQGCYPGNPLPCRYTIDQSTECRDLTACRDKNGDARCRAHGGRQSFEVP